MRVRIGAPLLGAALALLLAPAAQATTFCVPGFSAACQQGGGRIAEPSLDTALKANGQDGVPDRIVIAPGTVTTIVGTPDNPSSPAIRAIVQNAPGNGSINLVVRDTIVAGYEQNALRCEAPADPGIGNAGVNVAFSYLFPTSTQIGDCNLGIVGGVDAQTAGAPQFVGERNFRLPAGSPAIDSGDPQLATLPTEDYEGSPRPVDGDGDARRDMGAYERQPPPVISKLRFRRGAGPSRLSMRLSQAASLKASFRRSAPAKLLVGAAR